MNAELRRDDEVAEKGYERVFNHIREQLISGQLGVGDRLAPERELATRLGASRPVVREVLRALGAIGVIEVRHGYGSVVRRPDFGELTDLFTMMLAQQGDLVDDIMEARIAIERQAIRLACERASSEDLTRLQQSLARIEATVGDPLAGSEADFAFHAMMIEAAHSPTLASLHAAVATLLKRSHLERRERINDMADIKDYIVDHHRQLLAAIIERDVDRADQLLMLHFKIGSSLQRRAEVTRLLGR